MNDFAVLDNGLHAPDGVLQYAWFKLSTPQGERYRCVALRELASVPIAVREDYDLLGKQWAAVRGLYNAGVDFLYSAAGIFTPEHIGIVQYYGAAVEAGSREEAASSVQAKLSAVSATLAASYPQSTTHLPTLQWVEWYVDFITRRSRNILALLGHPDPRETRRGLGKEGELPNDTGEDLAAEQNELLFRGLAKLREDFIFQVTAEHIGRKRLAQALVRVAQAASNVASRRRGSIGIGFSVGLPLMAAISNSHGGGYGHTDSQAHSTSEGVSHGWGESHTDSQSHTDSSSHSWGQSVSKGQTLSHADSQADSTAWGHTDSRAHTDSQSHPTSQSVTQSESTSQGTSSSQGSSSNWSESQSSTWSQGESSSSSSSAGSSTSQSATLSESDSTSLSLNGSVSAGVDAGIGEISPITGGVSGGVSAGGSVGTSSSSGASLSAGTGTSVSTSSGESTSSSTGGSASSSVGGGSFSSTSQSTTQTSGTAVSQGTADSVGSADTVGSADSVGGGHSQGFSDGIARSRSVSKSWANTVGSADTQGTADGTSQSWGRSHATGETLGAALSRSSAQAVSGGFSAGLAPGVSINRSWQTEDDVADRVTEVLRQLEALLNVASAEGGFMTDALLFTAGEEGASAAEALIPQAFHGPNVPTPVLTVRPQSPDADILRRYAWAFLPYGASDAQDPFDGLLWGKYATLLTAGQVAAYTAPGLIEEGTAVTVMPPIPADMGFIPQMPGNVMLGHQVSPTTRDLTAAPLRLDPGRLMHTLFAGDTGFGKSVAAIRMAYETTLKWKLRTVVLDFGAGWRQLLNAQGLEGHVDILQLWPNAVRPLRWNPLQIGRNIDPETQWRAFADIFGSIARLGVKRQKQELLEALRQVYIGAGVLVDDPDVRQHQVWGVVCSSQEANLTGKPVGTSLDQLTPLQRQRLAVARSMRVGLKDLEAEIDARLEGVPLKDAMLTGVLEGIKFRLNPLVQGAAAAQFAPGEDVIAVEDLGKSFGKAPVSGAAQDVSFASEERWGVAIIEGGMFLDDFGKAFLLGWIGWHLYTDMVARRVHEVNNDEPILQIFFEEANKIFAGADSGGGEEEGGGVSASQRFGDMFRDARKYKARLHVITQAPHMLPADIVSSCNNLVLAFLKNPKDKDLVLSALARSEKGFRDEEWRRFVSDIPIGLAIGRFPYTMQRELQRTLLFRPLIVDAPEPTDEEIEQRLGKAG